MNLAQRALRTTAPPLLLLAAACTKSESPRPEGATPAASTPASTSSRATSNATSNAACAHAACSDHFYVDAVPGACATGATCSVQLEVVATGDYHINDDYPYRFKADDAAGLAFQGSNPADHGVFSKGGGDWQKTEARTGAMTVRFTPENAGDKTIAGTFKISVCSAENCLLEQPKVRTVVAAK